MSKLTDHITNVIGKIIDVHEVNEFDDNFSYSHKISPVDVIEILQEIREMAEEYPPLHDEQPKISIPKKIAEELLEGDKIKHPSYELMFNEDGEWSEELQEWMGTTDKWWAIVDAYLAGKALGVELVEVSSD